jgi:hypothetical protein
VDIAYFGETGLLPTQRDANGAVLPLPFGADMQRTKQGTLALRASGTELEIFPSGGSHRSSGVRFHRHRLPMPSR